MKIIEMVLATLLYLRALDEFNKIKCLDIDCPITVKDIFQQSFMGVNAHSPFGATDSINPNLGNATGGQDNADNQPWNNDLKGSPKGKSDITSESLDQALAQQRSDHLKLLANFLRHQANSGERMDKLENYIKTQSQDANSQRLPSGPIEIPTETVIPGENNTSHKSSGEYRSSRATPNHTTKSSDQNYFTRNTHDKAYTTNEQHNYPKEALNQIKSLFFIPCIGLVSSALGLSTKCVIYYLKVTKAILPKVLFKTLPTKQWMFILASSNAVNISIDGGLSLTSSIDVLFLFAVIYLYYYSMIRQYMMREIKDRKDLHSTNTSVLDQEHDYRHKRTTDQPQNTGATNDRKSNLRKSNGP